MPQEFKVNDVVESYRNYYLGAKKHFVDAYGGLIWPSRIIGFGIGVIVFTIMAQILFGEPLTSKTIACLILSLGIILVQLFWK